MMRRPRPIQLVVAVVAGAVTAGAAVVGLGASPPPAEDDVARLSGTTGLHALDREDLVYSRTRGVERGSKQSPAVAMGAREPRRLGTRLLNPRAVALWIDADEAHALSVTARTRLNPSATATVAHRGGAVRHRPQHPHHAHRRSERVVGAVRQPAPVRAPAQLCSMVVPWRGTRSSPRTTKTPIASGSP